MVIRLNIFEGHQYRVGNVTFEGNTVYTDAQILEGKRTLNTTWDRAFGQAKSLRPRIARRMPVP